MSTFGFDAFSHLDESVKKLKAGDERGRAQGKSEAYGYENSQNPCANGGLKDPKCKKADMEAYLARQEKARKAGCAKGSKQPWCQ
jgi:hypothetical protein